MSQNVTFRAQYNVYLSGKRVFNKDYSKSVGGQLEGLVLARDTYSTVPDLTLPARKSQTLHRAHADNPPLAAHNLSDVEVSSIYRGATSLLTAWLLTCWQVGLMRWQLSYIIICMYAMIAYQQ